MIQYSLYTRVILVRVGVYAHELQLSDQPVLGDWTVAVNVQVGVVGFDLVLAGCCYAM